ncbi:MAG: ThuA domain-containing protein [Cytophagales bacterium]|nr:ThuA domain-containing protein [Cytophagales bacterium]
MVFSKTAGFRHESIKDGKAALLKMGTDNGFKVDTTESSHYFSEDSLQKYSAVIFLCTTGDVLTFGQQVALERYIQAGGGYVGIHAASDTEYDWPWYAKMVGGNFQSHPEQQKAMINVVDSKHLSTKDLPTKWERFDEWYNFKNLNKNVKVLATIDEKSYKGGNMGDYHPMAWYHEYDGGRAFYTALGHTSESYKEELFLKHVLGGINYAMGSNTRNYTNAKTQKIPDSKRFVKQTIIDKLDEPLMMAISQKHEVFIIERKGRILLYDPNKGGTKVIANLEVSNYAGMGIMGICLDPNYMYNKWVYVFYNDTSLNYNLSRFKFADDKLDVKSEQIIFTFKLDKEPGAHNGGTILFDRDGNLLISTGDNTPPWQANGYPPYDQRPGREIFDAQRTASNTQDYRGKILRIKPKYDKPGYTIPDGNLFPKNGRIGKPEIYIMGCRNPWRMSYDRVRNYIYWGEVGPDAGSDSTIGPKAYDEINQARKAGNFGWPYFVANNKPYSYMDLVQNITAPGPFFDPENVKNPSKNNTGAIDLPSPQSAFMWYPYSYTSEFPEVGRGGRTACAGPIYYYSDYKDSKVKFPKYFDNKLLIFEWMRDWVMAVTVDSEGNYVQSEPMLKGMKFAHPTHLAFAPDGSLYVLEYGYIWYSKSDEAKLSRIIYNGGNRSPVLEIATSDTIGAPGFTAKFTIGSSYDPDGDPLTYTWQNTFDNNTQEGKNLNITFTKSGLYIVSLTANDGKGNKSEISKRIIVGNTYPEVNIMLEGGNPSFYWPGSSLNYEVQVSDKEDKVIVKNNIDVVLTYIKTGKDIYPLTTAHSEAPKDIDINDNKLIAGSDCKACHSYNKKSVGPSFVDIANKYMKDVPGCYDKLAGKIIKGGGGVWGEHAMSAHPQIKKDDAVEMVKYIMSLGSEQSSMFAKKMPTSGTITFDGPESKDGIYYITASYKDMGDSEGRAKLSTTKIFTLSNSRKETIDADSLLKATVITSTAESYKNFYLGGLRHGSGFKFKKINLNGLSKINIRYNSKIAKGKIELRAGHFKGDILGTIDILPQGQWEKWTVAPLSLTNNKYAGDIYFTFVNTVNPDAEGEVSMINVDWVSFER